ncbi:MAG: hypothetical protein Q8910_00025 [Bacteroidota bacterium]|nr:hypothetical protein [Bacteroidota bacterium]
MTQVARYWDVTEWTLPFLKSNKQEQLQAIVACGSSVPFVPMNDYECLEEAKFAVRQAEDRYNMTPSGDDDLLDSALYQWKSAELSLNALLKELKAKNNKTNITNLMLRKC